MKYYHYINYIKTKNNIKRNNPIYLAELSLLFKKTALS